jgi:hypothetical protein
VETCDIPVDRFHPYPFNKEPYRFGRTYLSGATRITGDQYHGVDQRINLYSALWRSDANLMQVDSHRLPTPLHRRTCDVLVSPDLRGRWEGLKKRRCSKAEYDIANGNHATIYAAIA